MGRQAEIVEATTSFVYNLLMTPLLGTLLERRERGMVSGHCGSCARREAHRRGRRS